MVQKWDKCRKYEQPSLNAVSRIYKNKFLFTLCSEKGHAFFSLRKGKEKQKEVGYIYGLSIYEISTYKQNP